LTAVAAVVFIVGSKSGALSDDFVPGFDAVVFVDVGDEIFFFPGCVVVDDDGVDLDVVVEDRRLKK
jgi:hypothetical protein